MKFFNQKVFSCIFSAENVSVPDRLPVCLLRRIEGVQKWASGNAVGFFMNIRFLLNGETITLEKARPEETLLDRLREDCGLCGTKEGCNEGDCGACTVIVIDENSVKPLNACILLLGQVDGKAIRTVEGVGLGGKMHPVQASIVENHGSQCGFCTPGIVTSLVAAQINDEPDHDVALAGNLCRCTGYAPIIRAAQTAKRVTSPEWLISDRDTLASHALPSSFEQPKSADDVAALLTKAPQTRLIAGATDIGLWLTKGFRDISPYAFLNQVGDLTNIEETDVDYKIGAMVNIEDLRRWAITVLPSYAELLRRYASIQIRYAATIGGNIANGSPIGDNPPALIAADACIQLRSGENRRILPLEAFFIEYGKQDLEEGEFIETVIVPKELSNLRCYKISKRFDQDISAVCGCFNILVHSGMVVSARIAFGGMAGIPKRATHIEGALIGQRWSLSTIKSCQKLWKKDFAPLSDMRASSAYRLKSSQNLLQRYYLDSTGEACNVLEISA